MRCAQLQAPRSLDRLLRGLFTRGVEHRAFASDRRRGLQQQGGLANTGLAEQDQGAADEIAAARAAAPASAQPLVDRAAFFAAFFAIFESFLVLLVICEILE